MNCLKIITPFVAVAFLTTAANAVDDNYKNVTETPAYGTKALDYNDMYFYGFDYGGEGGLDDPTPSDGEWVIYNDNLSAWNGCECAAYYAFEVPAGSAVAITGGSWTMTAGTSSYWGEVLMWSSDNLDAGLPDDVMNNSQWKNFADSPNGEGWDSDLGFTSADHWEAYKAADTGNGSKNYDYFIHSGTGIDQFDAFFNYAANIQHFQRTGGSGAPGTPTNPNPFDPSVKGGNVAGFHAWGTGIPSGDSLRSDQSWQYKTSGIIGGRCMKDAYTLTGFPQWMVVDDHDGSGSVEAVVMIKLGGDGGGSSTPASNSLLIKDLEIEIRGAADTNGDLVVDVSDLGALATNYGNSGDWTMGDFTGDGVIDIRDLGILATHYGASYAPTVAVPEPSLPILIGMGLWMLLVARQRR